jgi:hypothetical protein
LVKKQDLSIEKAGHTKNQSTFQDKGLKRDTLRIFGGKAFQKSELFR